MKAFKLDEHPKITTGFKVPDGYFDSFTEQMMEQLGSETKVIPMHRKRNTWIYAAAAVLVLSLSLPIINQIQKRNQPDRSEIEDYLAYQNISQDYIVSQLDAEDIQNLEIDYGLEDKTIEEALPANIENYIIE